MLTLYWMQKISEHAVTILVNLSGDVSVLENLATDEKLVEVILQRIVVRSPLQSRESKYDFSKKA